MPIYEHEISYIYKQPEGLAEDKDYILKIKSGIDKKYCAAAYAEIPERYGNGALFLFFGMDPLNKKSHAKTYLAQKAKSNPVFHLILRYHSCLFVFIFVLIRVSTTSFFDLEVESRNHTIL